MNDWSVNFMNEIMLQIPENLENMKLPAPELLSYYKDLNERTIWIDYEIDQSVLEIAKKILQWNREDKDVPVEERIPIRLLIISPGGELVSALSLINTMELSKTPIYTYSMGETSSAALYILLAGQKRYALKDTTSVLHKGSAVFGGIANQIDSSVGWYKAQLSRLKDYVLNKTTLDARTYKKRQDDDWYLTTDEMLKYSFIDGVVDDIETIIG